MIIREENFNKKLKQSILDSEIVNGDEIGCDYGCVQIITDTNTEVLYLSESNNEFISLNDCLERAKSKNGIVYVMIEHKYGADLYGYGLYGMQEWRHTGSLGLAEEQNNEQ